MRCLLVFYSVIKKGLVIDVIMFCALIKIMRLLYKSKFFISNTYLFFVLGKCFIDICDDDEAT